MEHSAPSGIADAFSCVHFPHCSAAGLYGGEGEAAAPLVAVLVEGEPVDGEPVDGTAVPRVSAVVPDPVDGDVDSGRESALESGAEPAVVESAALPDDEIGDAAVVRTAGLLEHAASRTAHTTGTNSFFIGSKYVRHAPIGSFTRHVAPRVWLSC